MSLSFFSFSPVFNPPLPVQQLEFQMTVKREQVCDVRFPLSADGFVLEEEVELIEGETGNIAMLLFLQV